MDINDLAKQYADGRVLNALTAAVQQAYVDGYHDGMQHKERIILDSIVDGVQYVDLELPSGKMWSSTYVKDNHGYKKLAYSEASKLHIPTMEDLDELFAYCARNYYLTKDIRGIQIIGRNGEKIIIPYNRITEDDINKNREYFSFWIKDNEESLYKTFAYSYSKDNIIATSLRKTFMGYKLPIMLIKEK